MIITASNIAFAIATLGITYQDFKARAIHVLFLVLLICLGVFDAMIAQRDWNQVLFSLGFTTLVMGGMCVYVWLKTKRFTNPLVAHIGLGDVLFFLAVMPFFTFYSYMVFFISGLVISLVLMLVLRRFISANAIPLAGILSGYMLVLKGLEWLYGLNLFNAYLIQL
ncbi:MAG: hypothetical protein ABJM06_10050 [Gilvibacter sp.]